MDEKGKDKAERVFAGAGIKPMNAKIEEVLIRGTAPYVSNRFSSEAEALMREKQQEGGQAAKRRTTRTPKDFEKLYRLSMHRTADGRYGVPASGFRQALVSACRIVNFKMTLAKVSLFIEADGEDESDGAPLVLFTRGEPERFEAYVRNRTGVADIRSRGMWRQGWEMRVRVSYDADLFTGSDVRNLAQRVGMQIGIGAGRPDSKESCGQGWGTFELLPPAAKVMEARDAL